MGAQRIIFFVVCLIVVLSGIFYFQNKAGNNARLHVCTWSNYFPDNIIADFTQKTGIPVELSYVSSNEELFSKLRAGATGFDIILPSDYMVRQMTELHMLRPLDHAQLPNLKNLGAFYRQLPYDEGNRYSVPFDWGTTGIAVNTAKVKLSDETVGWDLLFKSPDPRHTSLLDDMREVFAAALLWRGQPMNHTDESRLASAKADILAVKNHILMFTSEPKPLILSGELTVSHIFSCDAAQAHFDNPQIRYFIPREGATLWTDNFAIPTSSEKEKDALTFINYFLDPQNEYNLIRQTHLATPNAVTRARLEKEGQTDPNFYPPADVMSKLHFLDNLRDSLPVLNRMWTELKS